MAICNDVERDKGETVRREATARKHRCNVFPVNFLSHYFSDAYTRNPLLSTLPFFFRFFLSSRGFLHLSLHPRVSCSFISIFSRFPLVFLPPRSFHPLLVRSFPPVAFLIPKFIRPRSVIHSVYIYSTIYSDSFILNAPFLISFVR